MEPVDGGKIVLRLEIKLLLFYMGAAGACTVSILQPGYLEVDYTHKAVTIECTFSATGCPSEQPESLWFRYSTRQPENLCLGGCTSEADKFTVKKALAQKQVFLTVNSVTPNDSAIYICGIAFPSAPEPRAKQTGGGTTLVVRETKLLRKEMQSLLVALLVLLCVYLMAVCVTFVVLAKRKSNTLRNKEPEDSQKKKSARRIFQEIAQELYHKRHMETTQQPEKDNNTYENRTTLSTYERP